MAKDTQILRKGDEPIFPMIVRTKLSYDDRSLKSNVSNGTILSVSYDRGNLLATTKFNGTQPFVEILEIKCRSDIKKHGPKILLYQDFLYKIGGIETFLYNFCKHFKDRNITLSVRDGDSSMLYRLSEFIDVVKDEGQSYECDVCLLGNYNSYHILNRLKANKVYQMIHGDFEAIKKLMDFDFIKPDGVDDIIAVSQAAHDGLKATFGYDSRIIYNLLDTDFDEEKMVRFITLSRATAEKGIARIIKMASEFKAAGKKFMWFLCSTAEEQERGTVIRQLKEIPEIVFIQPAANNKDLITSCDYLVQLSDTESFCYSAYEALQRKVPCILTDYPEAFRTIEDGKTGYILKRDLSNLDVEKIFNEIPTVESFKDRCDLNEWEKIFNGE